ncbi:MarR family winged helix-turn-helix transcriptional regulator [Caballeronia sordidicola]|jgi:DNA-binding MarR family transcriptional regulator|uniref:Transcriptional regulator, MarR family n=1 Tax=Caballeronia sordidicola TaxID=196367 RepID=A0A226X9U1_CABSO|nr:MarR family winged helix-turn-helix transcriptional regulator [Caballeronia sordidicola]OXC79618.1 Transcriptional regulator, MarR family [Caballeronia sordidicola]
MVSTVEDIQATELKVSESTVSAQDVFTAVVTNGPISDAWRFTLWSNYYTEPCFSVMSRDFDVGRDEFNVMSCLSSYGPMAAKTICEVTGRPKNSISRAVTRLSERKMIRRKINPLDRRESSLMLNESGRKLYERVVPVAIERQSTMLSGLSSSERALLDQVLNKLMQFRHEW